MTRSMGKALEVWPGSELQSTEAACIAATQFLFRWAFAKTLYSGLLSQQRFFDSGQIVPVTLHSRLKY
eukprot:m.79729 g.79729  ORF g.79729 m.79729 type:complete len:68 (-) comp20873_c0_seq2:628-831(-)